MGGLAEELLDHSKQKQQIKDLVFFLLKCLFSVCSTQSYPQNQWIKLWVTALCKYR